MHLAAEPKDDCALLVPSANSFLQVGKLAGIQADIGPPYPTEILNVRFPLHISGPFKLRKLMTRLGQPSKAADRAIHDIT